MIDIKPAACGVNCKECASYKVTTENDIKAAELLVDWYKERGWIGKNEGAEAIMKKNPLCKGCRNTTEDCFFKRGCHNIDFRVCCNERQIDHCGECVDFPCENYRIWALSAEAHKKALEHLISLRGNYYENS